jgi:hypothetical protein
MQSFRLSVAWVNGGKPNFSAVLACLFGGNMFLRLILGKKRADDFISEVLEKLVRIYQRISGTA